MGIFDALNTSVGGLQAQSFALQNISGNIANASTVGYKGINTSFEDLIPAALAVNKQVAGGVTAHAQQTITTQGTVSNSTVATNIAINGDGFFDVQKPTGITDNVPTFNGVTDYTRAGDFQVNAQGYLVNSAGYYLMGTAVDPKTGNALGSVPTVLQFNNNFVPAQATTTIQYAANLPTVPVTQASPNATQGSFVSKGGLNPADFSQNPEVLGTAPPAFGNSAVVGNQVIIGGTPITSGTALSTLPTSIAGKSITVDGHVIDFSSTVATSGSFSGAGPFTINVNDPTTGTPPGSTVGTLLGAIDTINGNTTNPSTISTTGTPGEITLNTGLANNLVITDNNSNAIFSQLGFSADPAATRTGGGGTGTGAVANSDLTTFDNESISGGAITVYNSAGTPVNVQLRWALVAPNTWNLFYQSNSTPTLPSDTTWTNVGQTFTFNSNGNLVSPTGGGITIPNLTVNNQQVGDVRLNIASGALSQFASTTGNATVGQITQNGFAAGQLQSVAINNSGLVVGTFSNGQNIDLASITLSHFNGTNYLQALDGQAYAATAESGPAIQGASGSIAGSSLEGSNTDIADEFTKLIVTQQAYSANTKVITTANDMVQSLLNVLR
ncbi:flagellar hook protein FlgE [Bradyrhizobium erythrophlei]|jgi:flagellar hook protein FlgE|uniref:Flagellar hook protein FlgE n=1 Tax=Bradyrhizobium erythrophlei TaxID=1437360 RepID=A0A1M7UIU0_9BRAD|nr:flagellar hook-basal body complex protein [Bradyrhizobium erythrophlei]SHN82854.1 flagellar hook protein FlgE [Bradyrhizobium erythrophlei]